MEVKEIYIESKFYPEKLREISNPPKKIYVLGNEQILNEQSLSIVGSRDCSEYGMNIAKSFSKELAMQGVCIVSGMARGIDSMAHIGAIEAQGKTIAVLGSGFNHVFPSKDVFNKILEAGGAVITEYEEDVEVFPQGFRDRNRIVAGISIGTLVIEAKEKSGTGITAEYVKKFNRKLFCIPHMIGDIRGVGTNRLLKRGAILVTETQDIIQYYENTHKIQMKENQMIVEIPEEYRKIYDEIEIEPINSDEISKKVKMSINEVNTILTMLELEGFIENLPGNYFKRK